MIFLIVLLVVALFLLYRMYTILSVIEEDYRVLKDRLFLLEENLTDYFEERGLV